MRDRDEEKRLVRRFQGIWAVVTIWIAYSTYISITGTNGRWFFIILGGIVGMFLIVVIWFITRRGK